MASIAEKPLRGESEANIVHRRQKLDRLFNEPLSGEEKALWNPLNAEIAKLSDDATKMHLTSLAEKLHTSSVDAVLREAVERGDRDSVLDLAKFADLLAAAQRGPGREKTTFSGLPLGQQTRLRFAEMIKLGAVIGRWQLLSQGDDFAEQWRTDVRFSRKAQQLSGYKEEFLENSDIPDSFRNIFSDDSLSLRQFRPVDKKSAAPVKIAPSVSDLPLEPKLSQSPTAAVQESSVNTNIKNSELTALQEVAPQVETGSEVATVGEDWEAERLDRLPLFNRDRKLLSLTRSAVLDVMEADGLADANYCYQIMRVLRARDFFNAGSNEDKYKKGPKIIPTRFLKPQLDDAEAVSLHRAIDHIRYSLVNGSQSPNNLINSVTALTSTEQLTALKLIGARLLQEGGEAKKLEAFRSLSTEKQTAYRFGQIIIATAEMWALRKRLEKRDLKSATALEFAALYKKRAQTIDFPDGLRQQWSRFTEELISYNQIKINPREEFGTDTISAADGETLPEITPEPKDEERWTLTPVSHDENGDPIYFVSPAAEPSLEPAAVGRDASESADNHANQATQSLQHQSRFTEFFKLLGFNDSERAPTFEPPKSGRFLKWRRIWYRLRTGQRP